MNRFLYKFALQLPQIRDRLGMTQAALAEKSGISKPTIVAIEGDPSRLSRTHALALLFVIASDLAQRESTVKSIDYSDVAKAAAALAAAGFTAKTFHLALGAIAGALVMPTAVLAAIPLLFRGKSSKKPDATENIDSSTLKKLANESIDVIRKEIQLMLGVKSLTIPDLMAEIEKNEPKEDPS